MNSAVANRITSEELRALLTSSAPPRVIDVRTPAEFETSHIAGAVNVPLDVVEKNQSEVASRLGRDRDVVLVRRTGQRAAKADQLLRGAGLTGGRVLDHGVAGWEGQGFELNRGVERWDLERQVRLVAGSVVLSSILGSVAVPKLKWVAAAIGGGLTYAAVSNTCAMASLLSKLPYNRGATPDTAAILTKLGASRDSRTAS
ncbi:sulfurtransferase [Mycobacterium sp. 1274761.0]|nr:sulfurtransferase [Mycobacterium sp. 1274761.0]